MEAADAGAAADQMPGTSDRSASDQSDSHHDEPGTSETQSLTVRCIKYIQFCHLRSVSATPINANGRFSPFKMRYENLKLTLIGVAESRP